ETLQIEGPVLTVDEDVVKVELPQNVDHPWRGEGKAVATRLAAGRHGGLDPVRLLHWTSSCVLACRKNGAFGLAASCRGLPAAIFDAVAVGLGNAKRYPSNSQPIRPVETMSMNDTRPDRPVSRSL